MRESQQAHDSVGFISSYGIAVHKTVDEIKTDKILTLFSFPFPALAMDYRNKFEEMSSGFICFKMLFNKMSSDKMSSDKMLSDKILSDKILSDKMPSDIMLSDKMSSDKMSNDKLSSDKLST
jgi:hypothetical protein